MSGCDCHIEIEQGEQRRTLILLLAINAVMFCIEFVFGIVGQSTGLISDAVDMLADALVYGVGLYAVGKSTLIKTRAAYFGGVFQIVLALGVLADVFRRFLFGSEPESMFLRRYFIHLSSRCLLSQGTLPIVRTMRYLAWIAVFSLQLGMFVCGAGIDVCHAADTPSHIASSQSSSDHAGSGPIDQTCAAHAAHVFLGQLDHQQGEPDMHSERVNLLASLNLPEILHLIEQPPKLLHS